MVPSSNSQWARQLLKGRSGFTSSSWWLTVCIGGRLMAWVFAQKSLSPASPLEFWLYSQNPNLEAGQGWKQVASPVGAAGCQEHHVVKDSAAVIGLLGKECVDWLATSVPGKGSQRDMPTLGLPSLSWVLTALYWRKKGSSFTFMPCLPRAAGQMCMNGSALDLTFRIWILNPLIFMPLCSISRYCW